MPQPVAAFTALRWRVRVCSAVEFSANMAFNNFSGFGHLKKIFRD